VKTSDSQTAPTARRPFSWFLLLCCVVVCLVTARLGVWQMDRAHEKTQLADAIADKLKEPAWTLSDFSTDPSRWQVQFHPVALKGQWQDEHTFFLGNRTHQGGTGFWVFTPLVLEDGQWILVKRGWSPRHPVDPSRLPRIAKESGVVSITGRLDAPPTQWMTLSGAPASETSTQPDSKILDNVDMKSLSERWQHDVRAVVLQTDPSDAELRRDWPAIDVKVDTHWGYAFQWFALSFTSVLLFLWYQWFKPWRETQHD
jgi:surfeit locus 1 family protein